MRASTSQTTSRVPGNGAHCELCGAYDTNPYTFRAKNARANILICEECFLLAEVDGAAKCDDCGVYHAEILESGFFGADWLCAKCDRERAKDCPQEPGPFAAHEEYLRRRLA